MKKKIALIMTVIMLLTFTGCQKAGTDDPGVENPPVSGEKGEITESELFTIIEQIYEIKNPDLALGNITVDLTDKDSVKYYSGLDDISKVKDIAVSEAMIGSQAYSLVLVQTKKAEDARDVADKVLSGIDQRKWICVEADDLQVVGQGDLIMLFMVSSELKDTVTSQEMVAAFKEIRGGQLDIED